jgi:hypothetical protein
MFIFRVLAALALGLLFVAARPTPKSLSPDDLYSRRALRRVRFIIEMRLLELRKDRLECVRQAILRNLPPDLRPPERRSEGRRRLDPETCRTLLQY